MVKFLAFVVEQDVWELGEIILSEYVMDHSPLRRKAEALMENFLPHTPRAAKRGLKSAAPSPRGMSTQKVI